MSNILRVLAVALALLGVSLTPAAAQPTAPAARTQTDYAAPGPYQVAVLEGVWRDAERDRDVPWLIRYPQGATGRLPIVLFSHGLGGSRYGAAYYGDHLASHGYVVLYVQHPGSDTAIWGGVPPERSTVDWAKLSQIATDPGVILGRFGDIPFALERLRAMDAEAGPLQGRLDLGRMGMSGHSFGAVTTQAMAGQRYPAGSLRQPEFKAFLAMSPSADRRGADARAFAGFDRPFLFLTGTEDRTEIEGARTTPTDRLKPFANTPATTPAVQMVLTGGDHMVFSGRSDPSQDRPKDARFHALVEAASLAFWDAYLKDDDAALHWLRDGGLAAYAGPDGAVSVKGPVR